MLRFSLLAALLFFAACDAVAPAPDSASPDMPLTDGRFDGTMASPTEAYTLKLYLEEGRSPGQIGGAGGALFLGTSSVPAASTLGERDGERIRFTTTLRTDGYISFSGRVMEDGQTLVGTVGGEAGGAAFGPAGVVLRWQDLNYGD